MDSIFGQLKTLKAQEDEFLIRGLYRENQKWLSFHSRTFISAGYAQQEIRR
jgi:hypothetical protein